MASRSWALIAEHGTNRTPSTPGMHRELREHEVGAHLPAHAHVEHDEVRRRQGGLMDRQAAQSVAGTRTGL